MTLRNAFYYSVGLGFLALAKTKNVFGDTRRRNHSTCVTLTEPFNYDFQVVDDWLSIFAITAAKSRPAGRTSSS